MILREADIDKCRGIKQISNFLYVSTPNSLIEKEKEGKISLKAR